MPFPFNRAAFMRISFFLSVTLTATVFIGCSSTSDSMLDTSTDVTRSHDQTHLTGVEQPVATLAWEATDQRPGERVAQHSRRASEVASDELNYSDLDAVGPAAASSATSMAESTSKPGIGNDDGDDDLLPPRPAIHLARRSEDDGPLQKLSPQRIVDPNLPAKIELREARSSDLKRIIAGFHGQVVFVDFWASWCGPCVGAFPNTVYMHQRAHQYGLRVITVSLDKPLHKPNVLRFLQTNDATCVNLLARGSGGVPVSYEFGIPDGAIPHFKLYDRQGRQRYDWTGGGQQVARDVMRRVTELLREK